VDFNKIFRIDWFRFVTLLTPPFLRKIKQVGFVFSLIKPLEDFSIVFRRFREESIYRVTHNGQVYSLENVLNDEYDPEERRIFIEDSFSIEGTYVFPEEDERPVIINSETSDEILYIYSEESIRASAFDFVVNIPSDLRPTNEVNERNFLIQASGLIDIYKLASKRYEIIWI